MKMTPRTGRMKAMPQILNLWLITRILEPGTFYRRPA